MIRAESSGFLGVIGVGGETDKRKPFSLLIIGGVDLKGHPLDIVLMVIYATICLGFLVLIHEGGHYLASRAFGVRVSEFMLGLPGPSVGFTRGDTRFGVTAVPLGGYARVCGMEPGEMSPHLKAAMASVYARGEALMEDVAADCGISDDEAYDALEELLEWGSITGPTKKDEFNTYRTPAVNPTRKEIRRARAAGDPVPQKLAGGTPRPLSDVDAFFVAEYKQQYRSLPYWKKSVILLAGITMNILFALLAFIFIYSVMGFDYQIVATGEITHVTVSPWRAIQAGFVYIGMVVQAVVGLFNPATVADTVSNSTSIMGIAVLSKSAAEQGFESFLSFTAMLSVSLGIMNLLPIPPLDGGRWVVETVARIRRRSVSVKVLNALSMVGMALFVLLFVVMMNQDIQRFVFGNW